MRLPPLHRSSSRPTHLLPGALLATLLACGATAARADTLQSLAHADGHLFGLGAFTDVEDSLFVALVLENPVHSVVRRAAFEYDLSGIPAGSQIVAVTWRIQTSSEAGEFDVHGYAGDGAIAIDDATVPDNVVGDLSGGLFAIRNLSLDVAWMQALLDAHAPFAGLMVRARPGFPSSLQISTKEISSAQARAAQLTVEYTTTSTSVRGELAARAFAATLLPNAPNPFNPLTTLRFELAAPTHARLSIHDAAGRRVRLVLDAPLPAGGHAREWDGRDEQSRLVANGTYLQVLDAAGTRTSRPLVLLK